MYLVRLFVCFIFFASCKLDNSKNKTSNTSDTLKLNYDTTTIEYSQHFSIHYKNNYKIVHIYRNKEKGDTLNTFILAQDPADIPSEYKKTDFIKIPLTKIACLSSLYVAHLEKLELLNSLCAVDNIKYIYNANTQQHIYQNKIDEVGSGSSINFEKLALLQPDIVFTYWEQGLSITNKLSEIGIKPILVIDHLETSPLGRTEWIKLMAALFNEEKKANVFFNTTKENYNSLLLKTQNNNDPKPSVLVGSKLSDAWYVPGGKSYMATLIKDAGGNYLWKENNDAGSLPLNFETVLAKAQSADIWLNVYQWRSINDVLRDDNRYVYFKPYQKKNIYNNNARLNEYGGNDYWESGLLHPDLLLSDLINIFHPQLLPPNSLNYYKKLE